MLQRKYLFDCDEAQNKFWNINNDACQKNVLIWCGGKTSRKIKCLSTQIINENLHHLLTFRSFRAKIKTKNALYKLSNVTDLVTLLLQSKFALTVILKVKVLLNSTLVNKTKRANLLMIINNATILKNTDFFSGCSALAFCTPDNSLCSA